MDKEKLAERLLSMAMEPAQAASVVGDLLETGASRSVVWFWSNVLQMFTATTWRAIKSQPIFVIGFATVLLLAAILVIGLAAYATLPTSVLPKAEHPTIQVQTFYPGARPDIMATAVTAPLEQQFGELPGLQQMTSTNSIGASSITLQFTLNLNLDIAEQEVQAAINASRNLLPSDLPAPGPIYAKVNPADAPVLSLALTSDTLPISGIEALVKTSLAPKISQLSGVGLVTISGVQKPGVRVQADHAVIVEIRKESGANRISVVKKIDDLLPKLQTSLPISIKLKTLTDSTTTMLASVKVVEFELMLAIGLVVMVIILFLRNGVAIKE